VAPPNKNLNFNTIVLELGFLLFVVELARSFFFTEIVM